MVIMSTWIQQKVASTDVFSNALFCLWLSTASLVPSLELFAAPEVTRTAEVPQQAAQPERVAEPT